MDKYNEKKEDRPVQISLFDYITEVEANDREVNIKGVFNPKVSMEELEVIQLCIQKMMDKLHLSMHR